MVVLGIVALFFRPLIMWVYNGSGRSVLIVAFFHSAFNSAGSGSGYATRFIKELIPGPTALLIPIAVVVVLAVVIAVLTRGRLGYEPQRAADLAEAGEQRPSRGTMTLPSFQNVRKVSSFSRRDAPPR
jgi:type IV secretory pathway VirB2 component (pilin)